jgi:hypothetical protein
VFLKVLIPEGIKTSKIPDFYRFCFFQGKKAKTQKSLIFEACGY